MTDVYLESQYLHDDDTYDQAQEAARDAWLEAQDEEYR